MKFTLFSNGTEFMIWSARNCDICAKAVHYNAKTDTYPKYRCAIQREIELASVTDGMGSKRAHAATHSPKCPNFADRIVRGLVKKHRNKGQLELFK